MTRTLMVAVLLAPLPVALAEELPNRTERCEQMLQELIASPLSYERAHVGKDGDVVRIEFDAMNRNGVPLRTRAECSYELRDGYDHLVEVHMDGERVRLADLIEAELRWKEKRGE